MINLLNTQVTRSLALSLLFCPQVSVWLWPCWHTLFPTWHLNKRGRLLTSSHKLLQLWTSKIFIHKEAEKTEAKRWRWAHSPVLLDFHVVIYLFVWKARHRLIIEHSQSSRSLLWRRWTPGKFLVVSWRKQGRQNDREMEWWGNQGKYGKRYRAADKKLIILLLYLAHHVLLPYSHTDSEDIFSVGLRPTEICRLSVPQCVCVCMPLWYFCSCHGNVTSSE